MKPETREARNERHRLIWRTIRAILAAVHQLEESEASK
jgi:hypothetical protein